MTDWYSSLFMSEEEKEERRNRRSYIRGGRNDRRVDGFDAYVRERARPNQLPEEPAGMRQMLEDVRVERGRQAARAGDPEAGANPVPFSVASGQSERPFGNSFRDWVLYVDARNQRPLPASMQAPVEDGPEPFVAREMPERHRPTPQQLERLREREPASASFLSPIPGYETEGDVAQEWWEAVQRARARERDSTPTVTDRLFRLIFGSTPHSGLDRLREENRELQDRIARGEFQAPERVRPQSRRAR